MPRGLASGTTRGLALVLLDCQGGWHWECQGVCHWFHKNATGSVTHFVFGLSDCHIACNCAVGYRVVCNHAMGQYPKVVYRSLDCVQSCSAFGFWAFVEMVLIMKKLCFCNKNERMPRLLCNKDCDSMDGNRHKATAQLMPNGKKTRLG